ncbi:hypothetical protein C1646_730655, partial [Rhizophagus diaphanus]
MLGYLRTATTDTDNPSSTVSEKYKKAREYLSSQIGDKQLEEDIIKASNKVVIDKSSEKVAEASKKEALKEIEITPEITETIVSTQKTDGSFEVSKEITDKLNSTSPESLVNSVITYDNLVKELLVTSNKYVVDRVTRDMIKEKVERILQVRKSIFDEDTKNTTISVLKGEFNIYIGNQHLRSYDDSVFETALTIYILRYVLVEHKSETQAAYERASSWLSKQLNNNKELEKELFSACEQYVIEEGFEETRQTVLKYLQERSILDDAHAIRTSQNNDGSFTLHSSILEQFKISSIDEFIKGITRYVGIKNLKNCDKSIWQTLFTITYFKYVSVDYESEWRNICEKANKWVASKQLSKEELEELDSACDQYLVEKAVEAYNNQTINVQVTKLDISSPEDDVETLKSYVGSLRLRPLYSACEQYLIKQGCEFLNSKNTTIVTEVLHKPSRSVIYGSDDRVSKATDLALKYTEDEVNRLFDNNVTM